MSRVDSKGMSGHQQAYRGKSDTWLTPPEIVKALGPFDTDPCCPDGMPWRTAKQMLTKSNAGCGLQSPWHGRVWLNPPYGPETAKWLEAMAHHRRGIALIFARTETAAWHKWVWPYCRAVLFLEGRLHFHDITGGRAPFNAGAPSALVAYSEHDVDKIRQSGIAGCLVRPAQPSPADGARRE